MDILSITAKEATKFSNKNRKKVEFNDILLQVLLEVKLCAILDNSRSIAVQVPRIFTDKLIDILEERGFNCSVDYFEEHDYLDLLLIDW